jgi:hypothetical protein
MQVMLALVVAFLATTSALAAEGIECSVVRTHKPAQEDDQKPFTMTIEFLPGNKFKAVYLDREETGPMWTTDLSYTFYDEHDLPTPDGHGHYHFSHVIVNRHTGEYRYSETGPGSSMTETGSCHAANVKPKM